MAVINEGYELVSVSALKPHPRNARKGDVGAIVESIGHNGFFGALVVQKSTGHILAGNHRYLAAKAEHMSQVPVIWVDVDDQQALKILLADNRTNDIASYDDTALAELLAELSNTVGLEGTGYSSDDLDELIGSLADEGDTAASKSDAGKLADRFGVPPFTILNAREGWWQERKRAWLALGIESELGREKEGGSTVSTDALMDMKGGFGDSSRHGTSVFDPVLAELAYRWFCPQGGAIIDPFAGGSVRGIVAAVLGRDYTGVELRPKQVAANQVQGRQICPDKQPNWIIGDSQHIRDLAPGEYDFVFGCPPYADLEVYSDDPRDLSTMPYSEFKAMYYNIIAECCAMLKQNKFACFVVGDARDKKGSYYGFPWHTVEAFQQAGLSLYNEAVLVTPVGTVAVTAGKQFESGRKLGKTHQNVLVFVKGDPKKATAAIGSVEFGAIEETRLDEES